MASGWLQKAQSAVFGRREETPQPYVVTCECGMAYSGIRAAKPQKTGCSRCGAMLFIFPMCPYPLPASVEIRMRGGDIVPEDPRTVEKPAAGKKTKSKKGTKTAAVSSSDVEPTKKAAPTSRTEPVIKDTKKSRPVFTPLRLVVVALLATVAGTVTIVVRNARYESARREVEPAIERGLKAYAAHDYSAASTELSLAVTALDRLGRDDAAARQVRQRAKEAHAAAGLLTSPLADVLTDLLNEKSEEALSSRVERRLAGQWLFFDAPLIATTDSQSRSSTPGLAVDNMMMVGKLVCRMEFSQHPGKGWPQPKADAVGRRTIFAAQLDTIRVNGIGADADAVIVLRGSTAVLWTSAEGYAGLVPPPTDEEERKQWQELLEAQRAALEPPQGSEG